MRIIYCEKKRIYPYFGYAQPRRQTAYVRGDLPRCVQRFVMAHELRHLDQHTGDPGWFRELDATLLLDWKVFPGLLLALLMNLAPARLGLLCRRIRRGK